MKIIGKIITAPIVLALTLVVAFFKFVVLLGGTVLTIIAILGAIGSVILMFYAGFVDGLIFLIVSAIVYGLPYLAALIVGVFGAFNSVLWGFLKS